MDTRHVDIAIIGAGTAGLNAVREAQKSGRSWLLIENGPYGTMCARVGCMPSKLLIAAANAAHEANRAGLFGVHVPRVEVDGPAVMARLRQERDRFAGAVVDATEALPDHNRLRGTAHFVDANTLEVTPSPGSDDPATRVTAQATVVATGSSPMLLPAFEAVREHVLTSDSVFDLGELPKSMAVVGTGSVGLELGQAFARLGVKVTFLDRDAHPGPCSDPQVVARIDEILSRDLDLNMNADVTQARATAEGIEVCWKTAAGDERSGVFQAVLAATGRKPNLQALNLAATGLPLDDKGRPPWNRETGQCGDSSIFLAGDVNGYKPLLHEAGDEGRISGANAARWPDVKRHDRRTGLIVVFSDPQMAVVGAPFAELEEEDLRIGQVDFHDQGRARVMAVNRGLMRIYARASDRVLLGAEMFGPGMEHMAHLLAWAIQEQTPVQHLLEMPIYHPTLEEGMRTALRDLARALEAENECREQDMSTSPGM